jgi:hypothetical protein
MSGIDRPLSFVGLLAVCMDTFGWFHGLNLMEMINLLDGKSKVVPLLN